MILHPTKFIKSLLDKLKTLGTKMKDGSASNIFYLMLKWEWAFIFDLTVYSLAFTMGQAGYYNIKYAHIYSADRVSQITQLKDTPWVIPDETYLKPCSIWRISVVTITLAWINLLVYMRQLPMIGKYIVILNDIIYTFSKFLTIFAIFLLSFTFGWLVLMKTGDAGGSFENFSDSFLKTMVMMSGEFEAGDIFFPEDGGSNPFPDMTYAMFIVFFILMSLLLLNLLVGLTVNDVNNFVEIAKLKKMSNRLKFVLNMERSFRDFNDSKVLHFCFKIVRYSKRFEEKIEEKDLTKDDLDQKSKMWKQVIEESIQEETTLTIAQKVRGIEYDMKKLREEREVETQRVINMNENFQSAMQDLKSDLKGMDDRITEMDSLQSTTVKELKSIDKRVKRERKTNDERVKAIEDIRSTLDVMDDSIYCGNIEREVEKQRVINFMIDIGKYKSSFSITKYNNESSILKP